MVKQSANTHIWLGGDFNLGSINWGNGSVRPKAGTPNNVSNLLILVMIMN